MGVKSVEHGVQQRAATQLRRAREARASDRKGPPLVCCNALFASPARTGDPQPELLRGPRMIRPTWSMWPRREPWGVARAYIGRQTCPPGSNASLLLQPTVLRGCRTAP